MNTKEQLLQELEQTPEVLIQEVLDFLCFLKFKHPITPHSLQPFSVALQPLQQLADIGRRQPPVDALELSRCSRNDLEQRSMM